MDSERIEELLERYWQCETSPEEEAELRACFSKSDVPSHLRRYREWFAYQLFGQDEHLDETFDARVLAQIETEGTTKIQAEKATKDRKAEEEKEQTEENEQKMEIPANVPVVKARKLSLTARFMPLFKAAAAVAVLLTLGNVIQHSFFGDTHEVAAADTVSQQITTPSVALSEETVLHDNLLDSLSKAKRQEGHLKMTGRKQTDMKKKTE